MTEAFWDRRLHLLWNRRHGSCRPCCWPALLLLALWPILLLLPLASLAIRCTLSARTWTGAGGFGLCSPGSLLLLGLLLQLSIRELLFTSIALAWLLLFR